MRTTIARRCEVPGTHRLIRLGRVPSKKKRSAREQERKQENRGCEAGTTDPHGFAVVSLSFFFHRAPVPDHTAQRCSRFFSSQISPNTVERRHKARTRPIKGNRKGKKQETINNKCAWGLGERQRERERACASAGVCVCAVYELVRVLCRLKQNR